MIPEATRPRSRGSQVRPDDVLDREAEVDEVVVAADVDVVEELEQAFAAVPGHARAAGDDVVAVEGADRDETDVAALSLAAKAENSSSIASKTSSL